MEPNYLTLFDTIWHYLNFCLRWPGNGLKRFEFLPSVTRKRFETVWNIHCLVLCETYQNTSYSLSRVDIHCTSSWRNRKEGHKNMTIYNDIDIETILYLIPICLIIANCKTRTNHQTNKCKDFENCKEGKLMAISHRPWSWVLLVDRRKARVKLQIRTRSRIMAKSNLGPGTTVLQRRRENTKDQTRQVQNVIHNVSLCCLKWF